MVLLTAMEYIRGEEEQKENETSEKDDIQCAVRTNDNPDVELEERIEPKEAWIITQIKQSEASPLAILMMIGKLNKFLIRLTPPFREKGGANDCLLCLHCLLCYRCKFLL